MYIRKYKNILICFVTCLILDIYKIIAVTPKIRIVIKSLILLWYQKITHTDKPNKIFKDVLASEAHIQDI